MLSIAGKRYQLCDGMTRRDALRIGGLAMGGMALPQLLAAEASAGKRSQKAIIMIYMCGAPSHQDMYDLKMQAPAEIRGEFRPIATNASGMEICEHMPGLAKIGDKIATLRSVYGSPSGAHDSFICYTGRTVQQQPPGGWPSVGSTVSRLLGPATPAVPPFIGLAPDTGHPPYGSPGLPGFLGVRDAAFRPSGPARSDMKLQGITLERLADRRNLLNQFDQFRRETDTQKVMEGMDAHSQQAMNILTSSKLANAFNLEEEDTATRERYGKGDPKNYGDGSPRNLEHFLLARRLVEAGARVVTLNFGRWDFHSNNFSGLKDTHLPMFDQGLSALIEDLHARGLADDVSVVAWGEFGRTPKINTNAGRDHWPRVGGGLVACGGMKTGQVIGATDRLGGEIADRPIHFGEVLATLYHNIGIDANQTTVPDLSGRPQYLVDRHQPMPELI